MLEDKNQSRTNLAELGEFGLINHLTQKFDIKHSSNLKGAWNTHNLQGTIFMVNGK